ncbi:MAG: hypothetical protein NC102_04375 [Clostridium sp.]|nr:hypothetical protein [Clostridium sp.]
METEFWKFVRENAEADASKLRLKYHGAEGGIDFVFAITQIECRKKFAKKLRATLAEHPDFLFPSVLAGEQATSDLLAEFHAGLVEIGERVVDLTAGLGIDAWHIARRAAKVTAVERDEERAKCLINNFGSEIETINCDCREFLEACGEEAYGAIFIDPARRGVDGGRVFALADCEPNILEMLPELRRKGRRMIVKLSPMLDISSVLADLPHCVQIMSIGTPTECRELLAVVDFKKDPLPADETPIVAVTLADGHEPCIISFTKAEEAEETAEIRTPKPGEYLLEPYPAVMKTAPFNLLSKRYGIGKPHPNTHIYVGDEAPEGFPGEAFKIEAVIPYESKYIKRLKGDYPRIQVAARNFDVQAEALRKKLGVKDGGDKRLFAVTGASEPRKMMIVVEA